ncbi:uncharacterized protein LOC131016619 isoform X2 [Salvia miltiorrhiza]|uniref:uncharacterized protein LOC131016619 isoform X2 n=1 Tax=Salvia miltiorrhiza TaxID=226208 RepID=UPI0025AB8E55|nr:uncharacterized protein LOC131016619 isoform X2 [Salvia miltiorrhiza]
MARDLGFWLPSEFLTDDDLLTDFTSPPEDDDLVADLTRKLAHSALLTDYASKGWKRSGSPQSTLCGCQPGPTVSPNSVSGFCSPTDAEDYLRRDLLHAAAEEVVRIRMIEETAAFYSSKHFPPQSKPRTGAGPQLSPNSASAFNTNQAPSQTHLSSQLLQVARMKQQMMKNGDNMTGVTEFQLRNGRGNGGEGRAPMAAWPGFQQPGSGMRAVYLGEPGPKKERTGTGVFLPQRVSSLPAENRKKSEKVVHALNINVDSIDAQLSKNCSTARKRGYGYGSSNFDYDAAAAVLTHRKNLMMAQQRRNLAPQPAMNQQLRLPRDWTY